MICKQVSGAENFPVLLSEVKKHLNISHVYDDDLIRALLMAATQQAEQETARKFVLQTWDYYLDSFPVGDKIYLPWGVLQNIVGVFYTDTDDAETEWAAENYIVCTETDDSGFVGLPENGSWPIIDLRPVKPVRVRLTTGWYVGDAWADEAEILEEDLVIPTTANGFVYQCTTAGTTGTTEPATWTSEAGGITTDGTVGWTCLGETVPEAIKAAIKILVTNLYQNRESLSSVQLYANQAVESLLTPYRIWRQF